MAFDFPQFPEPTEIDEERSWTAEFDSYNERTDDLYYLVTVRNRQEIAAKFTVEVYPPSVDDWSGSEFARQLRQSIHEIALTGRANTEYQGFWLRGPV